MQVFLRKLYILIYVTKEKFINNFVLKLKNKKVLAVFRNVAIFLKIVGINEHLNFLFLLFKFYVVVHFISCVFLYLQ